MAFGWDDLLMTRKLEVRTRYQVRNGAFTHTHSQLSRCDSRETAQSGAEYVINTGYGYYWADGPMAGYYMDGRTLDNFKKKPYEFDILLPEERKTHVQLQLL